MLDARYLSVSRSLYRAPIAVILISYALLVDRVFCILKLRGSWPNICAFVIVKTGPNAECFLVILGRVLPSQPQFSKSNSSVLEDDREVYVCWIIAQESYRYNKYDIRE